MDLGTDCKSAPSEINATVNGNRARRLEGREKRTTYGGKPVNQEKLKKAEKRCELLKFYF